MPYLIENLIENLEIADNPVVLFRGIVGSRAYGTQNANSDTDVRGIFVVPSAEYARLAQPPKQVSDERNDRTYYSLVRFCELMSEANPTTMEMLFLPDDCIIKTSPAHSMLVANRGLFVTQKAVDSHLGYALSQIKKARGTNKRVWNPWPEKPPQAEDYCLFLGDANTLYYPDGTNCETFGLDAGDATDPDAPQNNYYLGAFRAYFHVDLNGGANAVRSFVLNFGDSSESTGIREIDTDPAPSPSPTGVGRSAWYSLDGRKLDGKPTKSGVYIREGKKVVIK
jgi:hypothetical protein